eukprot:TRINITY_DN37260_c0_g1_i1.p1 TRINITY_DN37260_c0_g1~~TRINITY_DN37260_c0_g1_i1.p1  ORF type:complete len:308 (+),score=115.13 TRINITY_DN37260_c0_g1_i1:49-924(+)
MGDPAPAPLCTDPSALAGAISCLRQVIAVLKEADEAQGDSPPQPLATPPGPVAKPERPAVSVRALHDALCQQLQRWASIHNALSQNDGPLARQHGSGDPELERLSSSLASLLVKCVGRGGTVGVKQEAMAAMSQCLSQMEERMRDVSSHLQQEEMAQERELKDWLRSHESRMRQRMSDMRDGWERHAAADDFLNSAEQRLHDQEAESADLIAVEHRRRADELEREQALMIEGPPAPSVDDEEESQEQVEAEMRRKAEKLERLRLSERNRAVRKGYATNPDYQPPQEFKFGT